MNRDQVDEILSQFEATVAEIKGVEEKMKRAKQYMSSVKASRSTLTQTAEVTANALDALGNSIMGQTEAIYDYLLSNFDHFAGLIEETERALFNLRIQDAPKQIRAKFRPFVAPAAILVIIVTVSNCVFGFLLAGDMALVSEDGLFAIELLGYRVNLLMAFAWTHAALIFLAYSYILGDLALRAWRRRRKRRAKQLRLKKDKEQAGNEDEQTSSSEAEDEDEDDEEGSKESPEENLDIPELEDIDATSLRLRGARQRADDPEFPEGPPSSPARGVSASSHNSGQSNDADKATTSPSPSKVVTEQVILGEEITKMPRFTSSESDDAHAKKKKKKQLAEKQKGKIESPLTPLSGMLRKVKSHVSSENSAASIEARLLRLGGVQSPESSRKVDLRGAHVVTAPKGVSVHVAAVSSAKVLTKLNCGARCEVIQAMRGAHGKQWARLDNPPGWIMIVADSESAPTIEKVSGSPMRALQADGVRNGQEQESPVSSRRSSKDKPSL